MPESSWNNEWGTLYHLLPKPQTICHQRKIQMHCRKRTIWKDEDFTAVLWRKEGTATGDGNHNDSRNGYVNGEVKSLTTIQKLVYDTVHDNPGIQTKQVADVLKKSPRTIEKHLAFLSKSNLIEHRDSDKTGGYYVKQ